MDYGTNLVTEPLAGHHTLVIPAAWEEDVKKHLEPFDPGKHNTKVIIAKPLPAEGGAS